MSVFDKCVVSFPIFVMISHIGQSLAWSEMKLVIVSGGVGLLSSMILPSKRRLP